jgi:uncharacterized tellurite resistance protein B-like protein
MDAERAADAQTGPARIEALVAALDAIGDPKAAQAARELVRAIIELHGAALADLLALVAEAGDQPADTLLPRFLANPQIASLLLLHDLHPQDLPTRVRAALRRLHPHLGVCGLRAELLGVDEDDRVRIRLSAAGGRKQASSPEEVRREIEQALFAAAPDAGELFIEGLEAAAAANTTEVPIAAISGRRHGAAQNNFTAPSRPLAQGS